MAAIEAIENEPPSGTWAVAKDLMAGTVGGWAQVMAAQPFDTVKVRSIAACMALAIFRTLLAIRFLALLRSVYSASPAQTPRIRGLWTVSARRLRKA